MIDDQIYSDALTEADAEIIGKLDGPILIVGASGFIGAKLFFSIYSRRADVFGISPTIQASWRLGSFLDRARDNLLTADVNNRVQINQLVQRIRPKTVFNLSAYGAYERQSDPFRIYSVNFLGTFNLLESLKAIGVTAFVQAGSSSEYGLNCSMPSENDELRPNSDYAVAKASVAHLIKYIGTLGGIPAVHLRLYSIYGPFEERDRLIPKLVSSAIVGDLPPLADRATSRDFVYIDDCLRAFLKAAEVGCRKYSGQIFNICTGVPTTLEELAKIAKEAFNISIEPVFGEFKSRKWDLSNWYGDPVKAQTHLGWVPRVSLKEGLLLTGDWEKRAQGLIKGRISGAQMKKISVIVACYNDNLAIPIMYERLRTTLEGIQQDFEIIFVNDSSPSSDEIEISKISKDDYRVIGISHSRNFGSQSAFLSGMEIATGDAVVLMDGDLQDPPEIIPKFIEKWRAGAQVVYGVRIKRQAPLHMQLLYKLFYRVFRKLADIPIPVDAGDFSLIDRVVLEKLLQLPERDIFLRGLRAWVGFKQEGVSYVRPERTFGRSTNNFLKNIWWAKKAIFAFSTKPLAYMQYLGVLMFLLSGVLAIIYLIIYLVHPPEAKGVTTIIILVLGLGGVQLLSVGILGEYLGKVLEEVKGRPKFIRSAVIVGGDVSKIPQQIARFVVAKRDELNG